MGEGATVDPFANRGGRVTALDGKLVDERVRQRVEQHEPLAGPANRGIEAPRLSPSPVCSAHGEEQRAIGGTGLPGLYGRLVELEEDSLTTVLDNRNPAGRTLAVEARGAARVARLAGADACEPAERGHHSQAMSERDAGELVAQFGRRGDRLGFEVGRRLPLRSCGERRPLGPEDIH